jgi:hypothetical protein
MVHLLLEDYVSKRNKIIKDPKFLELYGKYTRGIFGGAALLPKEKFIDSLAKAFDPTYKVVVNPQTNALIGDSRYLDFIISNLYSGNITPDQANIVWETLEAYRKEVARGNPEFSRDLQSYKVFFQDDAITDRQGEPLPGLMNVMNAYANRYDFEDKIHSNLRKTVAAFEANGAPEVYSNSMYKFFRVDSAAAAQILMGNRDPRYDPDFFTSGRSERCSGYWCLPRFTSYYPCWVAVDVFGFMDYAFVPKPDSGYSSAEIKNRYNHTDSVCKMSPAAYAAVLDFFKSHGDNEPIVVNPFKKSLEIISGRATAFAHYGAEQPGVYSHDDYVKFLVRMPDLESASKLTGEQINSNTMFVTKLCGMKSTSMVSSQLYQEKVGLGMARMHEYYAGRKIQTHAPLLRSIERMHGTSLADTDFSFDKYAAQFIPSMIDAFKQSFPHDTDLLANSGEGFTLLLLFINQSLPTIFAHRPELAGKIANQITKLVEEERLYFDETVEIGVLSNVVMLGLKHLMNTIGAYDRQFEQYEAVVHAINDSFQYYMSMGGAFNWKDSTGVVAQNPQILDGFATYIQNSTPENKQKLFDLYAKSVTNKLTSDVRGEVPVQAINGLFDVAMKLNLPREVGIKKIVTLLDNSITTRPSSVITRSVNYVMSNDEISSYVKRNKQFINKVAPHFAQLLAVVNPSSDFGKMYPKLAKIKLSQKYATPSKRREIFDDLNAQSNNELFNNRPELAFGTINAIKNSFGHSMMVSASMENIQKMISLRGNGYKADDFQKMLPNFAMLINAGFKPQRLFINFSAANVTQEVRLRNFSLSGKTLIKGDLNGKPVGITGTGMLYYLIGDDFRMSESFEELEQALQQALFDHYKPKPKHGLHGLYERVAATSNK